MNWFLKVAAVASTGLALLVATDQAHAATYLVSYASTGGAPMSADLEVTTTDVLNIAGGFDVTNVTGQVDGDTITGVINNPNQPSWSYSADGLFMTDNVFFDSAPNVSWYGLLFSGASGDEYNLFSDNASTYELYRAHSGQGYLANSTGTLQVAEYHPQGEEFRSGVGVPEPAAWALMIVGFGAVGGVLRRRRGSQTAVAT